MSFSQGTGQHMLYIVRYSSDGGIAAPVTVPLDDFQVHGMTCDPREVTVDGWDRRYTVTLAEPDGPRVTAGPLPNPAARRSPPGNLGHWATPGVTDLVNGGRPGEFQLVIARVSRKVPEGGGVEHFTFTALVRRGASPDGPVVDSVRLFEGVFVETVD
jgi:hypothetical protein